MYRPSSFLSRLFYGRNYGRRISSKH